MNQWNNENEPEAIVPTSAPSDACAKPLSLFYWGAFSEKCPKFQQGAPNESSGVQQSAAFSFIYLFYIF